MTTANIIRQAPAVIDRQRFPGEFVSAGAFRPDGTNTGWCQGCYVDFPAGQSGYLDEHAGRWCPACVAHVSACDVRGCCLPFACIGCRRDIAPLDEVWQDSDGWTYCGTCARHVNTCSDSNCDHVAEVTLA